MKKIKPFCAAPFNGLNIRSNGTIRTCAASMGQFHGIKNDQGEPININKHNTIEDAWNSKELKDLRISMLKGNGYQKHCKWCLDQENIGISSARERHNNFFPYSPKPDQNGELEIENLKAVDIRFNTKCDQACVMCGPFNSSMWEKEMSRNINEWTGLVVDEYQEIKRSEEKYINKSAQNKIYSKLKSLEYVELRGGEPLIDNTALSFLNFLIKNNISNNVFLSIVTNAQGISEEIINIFSQFKGGMIRCSVDSVERKNEYHRYHSRWKSIENGISNLSNLNQKNAFDSDWKSKWNIIILPTITAYNALQWIEYHDWINDLSSKINLHCLVCLNQTKGRPELNHTILSYKSRKEVADKLKDKKGTYWLHTLDNNVGKRNLAWFDRLIYTLELPQDENYVQLKEQFVNWSNTIKKLRHQDVFDYYPELKKEFDK